MTTSPYLPDVQVHIAFNAGYATPAASRTWTDVSAYVELEHGISITRGRADEFSTTDPNKLTLTLDNSDGRFTAGKTGGAYYPNVKIGRPIRVTSTPVGGVASVRFLGYVDEWPVEWNGTDNYAMAKITASSRMARLGFDAELPSTLIETYAAGNPLAYWTLGDPEGSTSAADRMGGSPLTVSGSAPVFGVAEGGPLNGGTSAVFASGSYLVGGRSGVTDAGTGALIELFVSSTASSGFVTFASLGNDDATGQLLLRYTTTAVTARVDGQSPYGDGAPIQVTGPAINDGAPHHLAARIVWDGVNTKTLYFYVDGVLAGTDTGTATASSTYPTLTIGNTVGFDFQASHLALNANAATIADRAAAGLTGFNAESAGDRIERYATYADIDPTEVATDANTGPVAPIDTTGQTVINAMRTVEETEGGVLFDARDNTLTFHGRARRYNATSVLTFNAALQELETGLAPKLDRSTLVNDVTATAADGTVAEAINSASITDYGYARESIDIASTHDDAYQAAAWRVAMYGEPQPRIPSLGVDLLPLSQVRQDSLFTLDVSSRITLSNLPTQAQATSLSFFIEGYTETISKVAYDFDFNVSPSTGYDNVWTLEDPVYGAYDSNSLSY